MPNKAQEIEKALRLALKTAEAMVYCCGHPRGGCPNHCDLLVKVIDAGRAALTLPAPDEPPCPDCIEAAKHAHSDSTTPGFFYDKCERHRAPAGQAGSGLRGKIAEWRREADAMPRTKCGCLVSDGIRACADGLESHLSAVEGEPIVEVLRKRMLLELFNTTTIDDGRKDYLAHAGCIDADLDAAIAEVLSTHAPARLSEEQVTVKKLKKLSERAMADAAKTSDKREAYWICLAAALNARK